MLARSFSTVFISCLLIACSGSGDGDAPLISEPSQDQLLKVNQIQVLGTHNSYHKRLRTDLFALLEAFDPDLARTLDYEALPLDQQFDLGVRQIELDIYADPVGGRYANRAALALINVDPASGIAALDEPGLKTFHVQEVDYESHCLVFIECLSILKNWSDANPNHLPIMVMIEAKEEAIPDPFNLGFVEPLLFGADEVNAIDAEIRSVFPASQLLLPDDVRGDYPTLEAAVLDGAWPTLAAARGKVMFSFLNRSDARTHYIAGHSSLDGRVMFVNIEPGVPEAAFLNVNNPITDAARINDLVSAGYIVRTRADAETEEARTGDTTKREAAFASGAQFISTDYPAPDTRFGQSYFVEVPGGHAATCNPITAPADCVAADL